MFVLRLLILVGLLLLLQFVVWYFAEDHIGQPLLYGLLTFTLGYKILHILYEWYHYVAMEIYPRPAQQPTLTVDMLTTYVPGEPKDMVINTLKAMIRVTYPHTTYLCDEGNDPELKRICAELGVIHVYRGPIKTGAKAGNINFTLAHHATGDIAVILDPDHVPVPEFLDRVLPYFADPKTGFAQCVQGYYNQSESYISLGAAEQTYMFYGPIMMGMQKYGTVQAIGANCTFRRAALDSIGGHATGLCEDMHTSMQIHAQQWTSVYVPELLTRGVTPASIGAYYQQQLKWSRGAFELLFEVYPKLFPRFSWPQRLHYFLIPLYFLYGLIGLIDLSVPIVSLLTYEVPLFIDFRQFVWRVIPVFISVSVIRIYVQRFVLDQHEVGLHFMGGILRVSCWWVYLTGLFYAILRIKVPYIPTPKAHQLLNEWKISLPNLVVVLLSIFAIIYGLHRDFTPFTWIMASFATMNVIFLSIVIAIGQQKVLARIYDQIREGVFQTYRKWWFAFRHRFVYQLIRNNLFAVSVVLLALALSASGFFIKDPGVPLASLYGIENKIVGWLLQEKQQPNGLLAVNAPVQGLLREQRSLELFEMDVAGRESAHRFARLLAYARTNKQLPLIRIALPQPGQQEQPIDTMWNTMEQIIRTVKAFQQPVLLQGVFASTETANDSVLHQYYRQLYGKRRAIGASNLFLVWENQPERSIPERFLFDIVTLPVLKDTAGLPCVTIPDSLRKHPVFLQGAWGAEGVQALESDQRLREHFLGWLEKAAVRQAAVRTQNALALLPQDELWQETPAPLTGYTDSGNRVAALSASPSIIVQNRVGRPGYTWLVDGTPFYIKGIVYNPQVNWRDGKWPLTRRRLESDFSKIKEMGANTISREKPTVYDQNILMVAEEMSIKVMAGFTFDPAVDYLRDTARVNQEKKAVYRQVERFKDASALLSWTLGGGTWEALADYFHPPYLSEVRRAYAQMIAELAAGVKQRDPNHPVITGLIGDRELGGALDDLTPALPYLDAVAINAYYPEQFAELKAVLQRQPYRIPYLISEFGPKVNWQTPVFGYDDKDRIIEPSSYEKARLYAQLWNGIQADSVQNLGGLAYCWRDRFEGTATFSGITDLKGRMKPAYFALQEVWTGIPQSFPLADLKLKHENIFANESINLVYNAMTANNLEDNLTYDWYICREEYLERVYQLKVDFADMHTLKYKLINEYQERVERSLYQIGDKTSIRYYADKAKPLQRIYLHIYDHNDHVVTASFPVYPTDSDD